MKILNGRELAGFIKERQAHVVRGLKRSPKLLIIRDSDNPVIMKYVGLKKRYGEDIGVEVEDFCSSDYEKIAKKIASANKDDNVKGIIIQLPLSDKEKTDELCNMIAPEKDVDGLTAVNQGRVAMSVPGHRPCTPAGILALLDHYGINVSGKKAVVLGRSILVGRPIALMLGARGYDATVTMCHSRTLDLAAVCREADIVIAAIGKPRFVTAGMIKHGAVVIDVGINRDENGRLCGDVDYENVAPLASAITPVPGGIGPMTISQLLVNTTQAWKEKLLKK